ncbi:hypothetical protein HMPREF1544_04676 [Mucor circinelloides 1006PhL]|uniref:Uncharacterized protein n=1 Tax=Mucor circinelloides f. circinelloides (strain 1006PhL) TaxID=1220926 RepID=S2K097_MUCC1|nr:hypothetical protein HMPREF1544_04676 [Mucor circinelloides 1006PhL]
MRLLLAALLAPLYCSSIAAVVQARSMYQRDDACGDSSLGYFITPQHHHWR